MIASAAVTFRSLVGGLNPNIPAIFAIPIYKMTVIRYGIYALPFSPKTSLNRLLNVVMIDSRASCFFPGFSTFRFRTSITDNRTSTAIMIHVTTIDSEIGIPPKIGMVKRVSQFSSSVNFSARSPVGLHFLSCNFFKGHTNC